MRKCPFEFHVSRLTIDFLWLNFNLNTDLASDGLGVIVGVLEKT